MTAKIVEFEVHEGQLTIDGTYARNTDTVTITQIDIGSLDVNLSPNIVLMGIVATDFVHFFHIGTT